MMSVANEQVDLIRQKSSFLKRDIDCVTFIAEFFRFELNATSVIEKH